MWLVLGYFSATSLFFVRITNHSPREQQILTQLLDRLILTYDIMQELKKCKFLEALCIILSFAFLQNV